MMRRLLVPLAAGALSACALHPGAVRAGAAAPLCLRAGDVGRVLLACWAPPADGVVTVGLSLRRDGTVLGILRITYLRPADGAGDGRALAASIVAAVRRCTPVRLSPVLQEVLPGQILRIRFTSAAGATTASTIWSGT